MPRPQPIVAVVDGAADRSERRVELDLRIAERDVRLYVASIECL
jgi:hypothetical protein